MGHKRQHLKNTMKIGPGPINFSSFGSVKNQILKGAGHFMGQSLSIADHKTPEVMSALKVSHIVQD